MGIRSVRRGIRKWRAKATQVEGKGPKKVLKNFFWKSIDRSSLTETWTLDPVVKPFGTSVKKEVDTKSKRRKNMGNVAGEGQFENSGQEPLGPLKRAKKFLKIFF